MEPEQSDVRSPLVTPPLLCDPHDGRGSGVDRHSSAMTSTSPLTDARPSLQRINSTPQSKHCGRAPLRHSAHDRSAHEWPMTAATPRSDPTRARRLHGRAILAHSREPKKRPSLWLRELDDGAAYSSDGVPSLPSSPVWAHAAQPAPQHAVVETRLFPSHTGPPSVLPRAHPLSMEYPDSPRHPCQESMSSFTMSAMSSRRLSHSIDMAHMNVSDMVKDDMDSWHG